MGYKSPIDVQALAKKGIFEEARFFRLLSEQNNFMDPEATKVFYMAFVRMITKELRDNGVVRLPHLGDIALVKKAPHLGFVGKVKTIIQSSYMMKFYPSETWRKYFIKLAERPGREGKLDPREKLLGREL